ncbi:hypothetical protein ACTA71_007457 [Dictyostelium dimigraforme]
METKRLVKLSLIILLIATIGILFVLILIPNSPVNEIMLDFMEWIEQIPKFWGSIILTLIYTISLVFCFPGTPLNFAAGYIFGPWIGSISTVVGCDLGAVLAFFIGRNLTKEWTESRMQTHPKYGQISSAVSKNGLLIIFLLRLSPIIPFGMCNYLFSATNIPFSKYWISTTLGLLPFTIIYTYLGSLMKDLKDIFADANKDAAEVKSSSSQIAYVTFGVIFSILIFVAVTVITKRTLDKAMQEQSRSEKLDLEKGLELPLIGDNSDDAENNNTNNGSDNNNNNSNNNSNNNNKNNKKNSNKQDIKNDYSDKVMFKRSPTDIDLSTDGENSSNSKDIILTINDDVQFQHDYENDDEYYGNDKTFLIKSNTYSSNGKNNNNNNNNNLSILFKETFSVSTCSTIHSPAGIGFFKNIFNSLTKVRMAMCGNTTNKIDNVMILRI